MKTKYQKRIEALNRLINKLNEMEKERRILQERNSNKFIPKTNAQINLEMEIKDLRRKLE